MDFNNANKVQHKKTLALKVYVLYGINVEPHAQAEGGGTGHIDRLLICYHIHTMIHYYTNRTFIIDRPTRLAKMNHTRA